MTKVQYVVTKQTTTHFTRSTINVYLMHTLSLLAHKAPQIIYHNYQASKQFCHMHNYRAPENTAAVINMKANQVVNTAGSLC